MLEEIKELLGIAADDTDCDKKLNIILKHTTARLKLLLGGTEPPEEMNHIIIEVAIMRFNRIGSEGLASHSVDSESLTFNDSDFKGYADEIQAWLNSQKESTKGKVRFL
jgi:hypothetical protein